MDKNYINESDTGLFNIEEFIGFPINVVNNYYKEKGWEMIDCYNDYKWAWSNKKLNKSIICNVEFTEDGDEKITAIWWHNGIYNYQHH